MTHPAPNDYFKRPGAHHAYEVDPAQLERVREALRSTQLYGHLDAGPLLSLTGQNLVAVFGEDGLGGTEAWWTLSTIHQYATTGEDFGLEYYGPVLSRADVSLCWGRPLIACGDPVSPFWLAQSPWLPQRIAPASVLLRNVPSLRTPDENLWAVVREDLTEGEEINATEIDVLIELWRVGLAEEVDRLAKGLEQVAAHDGLVMTWESEEGWL